jgi:hypothetical protein
LLGGGKHASERRSRTQQLRDHRRLLRQRRKAYTSSGCQVRGGRIDRGVRELKAQGMRPSDIAKALKIGRASVYRLLAS